MTKVVDTTDMRIIFAFDYQRLTPDSLRLASLVTPALRLLYPEDVTDQNKEGHGSLDEEAEKTLATPGLFANSELL